MEDTFNMSKDTFVFGIGYILLGAVKNGADINSPAILDVRFQILKLPTQILLFFWPPDGAHRPTRTSSAHFSHSPSASTTIRTKQRAPSAHSSLMAFGIARGTIWCYHCGVCGPACTLIYSSEVAVR